MFKEKKEKCLFSCLSDDTDYTVVILDWSFHCKGAKKNTGTVWEREHRSEEKCKRGGKLSIKLYLFPVDFHSPQNMNIQKIKKKQKHVRTDRTTTCRKQHLSYIIIIFFPLKYYQNSQTSSAFLCYLTFGLFLFQKVLILHVLKNISTYNTKQVFKKKIFPLWAVQLWT